MFWSLKSAKYPHWILLILRIYTSRQDLKGHLDRKAKNSGSTGTLKRNMLIMSLCLTSTLNGLRYELSQFSMLKQPRGEIIVCTIRGVAVFVLGGAADAGDGAGVSASAGCCWLLLVAAAAAAAAVGGSGGAGAASAGAGGGGGGGGARVDAVAAPGCCCIFYREQMEQLQKFLPCCNCMSARPALSMVTFVRAFTLACRNTGFLTVQGRQLESRKPQIYILTRGKEKRLLKAAGNGRARRWSRRLAGGCWAGHPPTAACLGYSSRFR